MWLADMTTQTSFSHEHGADEDQNILALPGKVKNEVHKHMLRSLSAPLNVKPRNTLRRMESLGSRFRVISSTPQEIDMTGAMPSINATADSEVVGDGNGEDIAEEEAVCRICMIELCEGGNMIKLECSCRGELSLAHRECAIKWFGSRNTINCEVCNQEVRNLPVTLLRIQYIETTGTRSSDRSRQSCNPLRLWLDMPVLVIVNMLSYFCFLEQLLVYVAGSTALAISLPFSCFLGFLASMTSSTMLMGKYIWTYASIQFVTVVVFAHLFFSVIHMQAITSIVLATFTGFGITVSGSSIIVEILRWRRRLRLRLASHGRFENLHTVDRITEHEPSNVLEIHECNLPQSPVMTHC